MLESFNSQTKQQFADKIYRVSNRELDQNYFVELKFFTSDEGYVIIRSYMKVQDILAQLATIFNIIFIIFDKFTHFFYNKKMEEIIMRRIFQICNDDLDEKPNLKQIELSQNPEKNKNFSIVFLNKSQNDISDEKSSSDVLEQKNLNEIKDIKILNDKSPNNVVSLFQNNNKGRKLFEFMYKERIIDKGKEFKIRLLQFIIYSICPCFRGEIILKNAIIYQSLREYVLEYTDILKFVEIQNEIEKLKYFLLINLNYQFSIVLINQKIH